MTILITTQLKLVISFYALATVNKYQPKVEHHVKVTWWWMLNED